MTRAGLIYDRKSLAVLGAFAGVAAISILFFGEYVDFGWAETDWFLVACWIGMLVLAMANVSLRRDVPLALAGFAGGAFIETWGTHAGLWSYFTGEKPPLFILPAWPAAALATARVADVVAPWVARAVRGRAPFVVAASAYVVLLATWVAPHGLHVLTIMAGAAILVVIATTTDGPRDLARFAAGCVTGLPLEIWGTTRECWTYAGGGTPPLVAVLSHGFATVAFDRAAALLVSLAAWRARPLLSRRETL